ncbi:hypothetical protein GBF38_020866 [Nibea albiflora]|uniref:Uncharacterized protein n=1 Tax=Nibea albiflora TaxID=240163 RepID=A0ACB7FF66_NIBAL|nr:hypothetical protein GBF38_020866 [Nibea albiflora]
MFSGRGTRPAQCQAADGHSLRLAGDHNGAFRRLKRQKKCPSGVGRETKALKEE